MITEHQNTEIIDDGKSAIFDDISTESTFNWESHRELSPLENQISKPLFDRQFLVHEDNLTDVTELVINPYALLVDRPEMKDMLRTWIYSRFDLEVQVKCITPAKSYGMLIGSWRPFKSDGDDYYPELSAEDWMVDENAFYLSYGEAESIIIPVNWTGPLHYIRHMHQKEDFNTTKDIDVDRFAKLGKLVLKNLGYKALGTATPFGKIQVFVRPINPVLQGPRLPGSFAPPEMGTPQSATGQIVPVNPLVRGALALGTAGGIGTIVANSAYNTASNFFNQVLTYTSKKVVEGTVDNFSNKVMSTRGMKKNEANKSTRSSMKLNPMGEISMMGYDNREESCVLSDKPVLTKIPERMIGRSDEDFNVYELCRRWAMLGNFELGTDAAVVWGTPFGASLTPTFSDRGYLPYFARCFRGWSGDLEVKIVIPSNALIMGRVQVSLFWGVYEWSGNLFNQTDEDQMRRTGPIITKTFDIRGTTEFEFLIPFLYEYPIAWCMNDDLIATPFVLIEPLVNPNDGSSNVPLQAYVFYRAGKNFRFYYPNDPLGKYQDLTPPAESGTPQGRIQSSREPDDFKEVESPEYSPYEAHAFHGTILDLCSRWSSHPGDNDSFPMYVREDVTQVQAVEITLRDYGIFGYMSMLYGFYSGEIERKSQLAVQGNLSTSNISMAFLGMDMKPVQSSDTQGDRLLHPKAGDGMQLIDTTIWRTLEYGIPFMARYQLAPLQNTYWKSSLGTPLTTYLTNPNEETTPRAVNDSAFWRPGINFGFHVLYPPLPTQYFNRPESAFAINTGVTPPP